MQNLTTTQLFRPAWRLHGRAFRTIREPGRRPRSSACRSTAARIPSGSARDRGRPAIREQSRLVRAYESEVADFDVRERARARRLRRRRPDAGPNRRRFRAHRGGGVPHSSRRARCRSASAATARSRCRWSGPQPASGRISACCMSTATPTAIRSILISPTMRQRQFSHTAMEQRISPSASYHVGIRGSTYRPGVMDHTRSLGYNVITMRDYVRRGEADVLAELHHGLKGRPSTCPGTWIPSTPRSRPASAPRPGAASPLVKVLQLLRGLAGLNIVAIDINTVSPPHDVNGMSGPSRGADSL